jgi:hypothetical protein
LNARLFNKYEKIKEEFNEIQLQIASIFEKTNVCFNLIVPDLTNEDFEDEWETIGENEDSVSFDFENEIEINLKESFHNLKTKDNQNEFEIIEESLLELNQKYIPLVKDWLKILSKVNVTNEESEIRSIFEENVGKLKQQIQIILDKSKDLNIQSKKRKGNFEKEENKKQKME